MVWLYSIKYTYYVKDKETILLSGGKVDYDHKIVDSLLILQNNGENWKQLEIKLPCNIRDHGAQFLNNNLYIFGGDNKQSTRKGQFENYYIDGANESDKTFNSTYRLSDSSQWEKVADLNKKRTNISNSNVIFNGQIWVLGGWSGKEALRSVEIYDPQTNEWKYMRWVM